MTIKEASEGKDPEKLRETDLESSGEVYQALKGAVT